MTLHQWLQHLRSWLIVFPWPEMRSHIWTREAIEGNPYTCMCCGKVVTEKELDELEDE